MRDPGETGTDNEPGIFIFFPISRITNAHSTLLPLSSPPTITDLIALLTETTPTLPLPLLSTLPTLHSHLTSSPEGRQLLHDRPIMSSKTIDMEKLQGLKRGTVGREWVEWANEGGVTPDSREEVSIILRSIFGV